MQQCRSLTDLRTRVSAPCAMHFLTQRFSAVWLVVLSKTTGKNIEAKIDSAYQLREEFIISPAVKNSKTAVFTEGS